MPVFLQGRQYQTPSDYHMRPRPTPPVRQQQQSPYQTPAPQMRQIPTPQADAYQQNLQQMPQQQNYSPSKMDRLGAMLAGVQASMGGGDGYSTARNRVRAPFDEAMYDWSTGQNYLKDSAEFERESNKDRYQYNNPIDAYEATSGRMGAEARGQDANTNQFASRSQDAQWRVEANNQVNQYNQDYAQQVAEFEQDQNQYNRTQNLAELVAEQDNQNMIAGIQIDQGNLDVSRGNLHLLNNQFQENRGQYALDRADRLKQLDEEIRQYNATLAQDDQQAKDANYIAMGKRLIAEREVEGRIARWEAQSANDIKRTEAYSNYTAGGGRGGRGGLKPGELWDAEQQRLKKALANHPEWSQFVKQDDKQPDKLTPIFYDGPNWWGRHAPGLIGGGDDGSTAAEFTKFLDYIGLDDTSYQDDFGTGTGSDPSSYGRLPRGGNYSNTGVNYEFGDKSYLIR